MTDYDEESTNRSRSLLCDQCEYLIDALREFEAQCREVEDKGCREITEATYFAKLRKFEHLRDCALDVLLKHQKLEHPAP